MAFPKSIKQDIHIRVILVKSKFYGKDSGQFVEKTLHFKGAQIMNFKAVSLITKVVVDIAMSVAGEKPESNPTVASQ